jgi:hypothetical protein
MKKSKRNCLICKNTVVCSKIQLFENKNKNKWPDRKNVRTAGFLVLSGLDPVFPFQIRFMCRTVLGLIGPVTYPVSVQLVEPADLVQFLQPCLYRTLTYTYSHNDDVLLLIGTQIICSSI